MPTSTKNDDWSAIDAALTAYRAVSSTPEIDAQKFALYSVIAHSTAIEGSTLTELDTQILFDDGLTAPGKPLTHHLMNQDLKAAYEWALAAAARKDTLTVEWVQQLNALIMHSTGDVCNVIGGSFDARRGDFRLCGVTAGYSGASYLDYREVPAKTAELCATLNERLATAATLREQYELSFDAHLNLALIHPWLDGNGRAARLLMNYLQFYFGLAPTKVYQEDKAEYITALVSSRDESSSAPFRRFMSKQLLKMLEVALAERRGAGKQMTLLF